MLFPETKTNSLSILSLADPMDSGILNSDKASKAAHGVDVESHLVKISDSHKWFLQLSLRLEMQESVGATR